ncbi:MAG TPA: FAD-binding protein [Candidatus Saccharimonadales bacterium]|nr:FAD-binding protein [Candidatus Saccharimonadales bacterium]
MSDWDYETDFLVAGTGMAGMSAAITAKRNGLDVLLVESMEKWGGTTAISGGGLWMPNNPLMHRDGVQDSPEAAFDYMKQTIGEPGAWASDERKWAFINAIPAYVNMLADEGVNWVRAKEYPDYYPDLPSGMIGRSIEPQRSISASLAHGASSCVRVASRRRCATVTFICSAGPGRRRAASSAVPRSPFVSWVNY